MDHSVDRSHFLTTDVPRSLRLAACVLVLGALIAVANAQTSVRASVSDLEAQADGYSSQACISADGRYITFTSFATNLVPGYGPTMNNQVFKRDLLSNTTTLVSVDALGFEANGLCTNPRISADGRYVIYSSDATNLDGVDANAARDVFRRDTLLGTTTRVSLADDESEGNAASDSGWMSGNGNLVVFRSEATNMVLGGTTLSQIFVRDISGGTTTLVSRENGAAGAQAQGYSGMQPSITPDGRYVGYSSTAANLVTGDTNGVFDVYVRDTVFHTNRRISIAINGLQGWQDSYNSSMSDDGRYVTFVSNQGFVNGDSNGVTDVFVRDVVANTMIRVSVDSQGKQANGASGVAQGWGARISGDGSQIAFQSVATNLVKSDSNGVEDIFVRDRIANKTTMISLNTASKPANGASLTPSLSANGQYVAFLSYATNIVSGDTNGLLDAFRRGPF